MDIDFQGMANWEIIQNYTWYINIRETFRVIGQIKLLYSTSLKSCSREKCQVPLNRKVITRKMAKHNSYLRSGRVLDCKQ